MTPRPGREFGNNLRSRFGWRRVEDDVAQELDANDDLRRREEPGSSRPTPAARAAIIEECAAIATATDRSTRRLQPLEETWQDLKHGWRSLRARPGFAAGSIFTIALGLGANTAIFALVNAVYLRPLPIDPDGRLVRIREYSTAPDGSRRQVDASRRTFDAVVAAPNLVSDAVIVNSTSLNLSLPGGVERIAAIRVSPGFTRVLNTPPAVGRTFTPDEENAGDTSGALLIGHQLWMRGFGGAPDVIGRTVAAGSRVFAVVGVMPPGFMFPYDAEAWFPARFAEDERSLVIFGHLAPGLSLDAANAQLDAIGRRVNEQLGASALGLGLNAVPARHSLVGDTGPTAVALMGSVAFLVLIACANVTMMMTSRLMARQKEVAIRASLGCGRWRQIRQFTTEAVLLFCLGAVAGWGVAYALADALVALLPNTFVEQFAMTSIPLDARVSFFALAAALVVGLVFGLIAAMRATKGDLTGAMKEGGRAMSGGRSRRTVSGLVAVEIALAFVLVAGAGLLIDHVYRVSQRDVGFRSEPLLTFQMEFRDQRFASGPARTALLAAATARLRALPGVEAVGVTTVNPFCCGDWGARLSVEGQTPSSPAAIPVVRHQLVTPDFFDTLGIRLREGRLFTAQDREGAAPVVVVDETFARRFWPGERATGKRVKRGALDSQYPWMTVVGIVDHIDANGEYAEAWYLPFAQWPLGPSSVEAHVMVRSSGDPLALVPVVRKAMAEIDSAMPVHEPARLSDLEHERHQQDRLAAAISGTLAASGLILAVAGVYALMSFAVAGDARDIGIRLALGAPRRRVLGEVLTRALRLAFIGALAGVPLTWLGARLMRSLIADIGSLDPSVVAGVAAVLTLSVAVAALIPARRALRIDPLRALRES